MENSKKLLEYTLAALNEADISPEKWSIGGGTVLAAIYNHRLSKDIDVFIEDVQSLSALSPRFNNQMEMALDYNEMSNYISLTFPEGKVDFIAAPQITKFSPRIEPFFGQPLRLDDPIEIVSKKLYFRGDRVLPRDVLDLAVVYESERKFDLINTALAMPEKVNVFIGKFAEKLSNIDFLPYTQEYEDMLLPAGKKIRGKEIAICQGFVECLKKIENIKEWSPSPSQKQNTAMLFNNIAKKVLEGQSNQWEFDTNRKIICALNEEGYSFRKINEAMSHSPLREKNMISVIKKLGRGLER